MKGSRRVHFAIESFPEEIQIGATNRLGKGQTYGQIRRWLASKGHKVSASAVGRWAQAVYAGRTDFGFNPSGCPLDVVVEALRAVGCREHCQRANKIEKAMRG